VQEDDTKRGKPRVEMEKEWVEGSMAWIEIIMIMIIIII
jgi:hypothetical protein